MKKKKLFILIFTVLVFVFAFQVPALGYYDYTYGSWSTENASYGPDDGRFWIKSYDSYPDWVVAQTNFDYDSSDISAIRSYYRGSPRCYPGIDITNTQNRFNARGLSSTLPDPDYDTDNDFP